MKKPILCLLAVLLLSGCGSKNEENYPKASEPTVIITGRHANGKVPDNNALELIHSALENSVRQEIKDDKFIWTFDLEVISCDGNPEVVNLNNLAKYAAHLQSTGDAEGSEGDEDKLPGNLQDILGNDMTLYTESSNTYAHANSSLNNIKDLIVRTLTSTTTNASEDPLAANDEEVNLVKAVNLAVNKLSGMPGDKKHLLILDSGINTVGEMSMLRYDIEVKSAEDILMAMGDSSFIQVPRGEDNAPTIDVTMPAIGDVGAFQHPCADTKTQTTLLDLWQGYFEKCGFEIVAGGVHLSSSDGDAFYYSENRESGDESNYPYVTSIPFTSNENGNYYCFKSAEIGFKADSSELRSQDTAERAISKQSNVIIKELERDPSRMLYVVGSVAKLRADEDHKEDSLAAERAQVVADMLVELGVDRDRIITINAGSHEFSWRSANEFPDGPNGKADKKAMESNRVVAVFSSKDEEHVNELVNDGYIKG